MNNTNNNSQKTWFVTGATRGIGAEMVRAILKAGEHVVATGRNVTTLRELFGPDNGRFLALPLDVSKEEQVKEAVAAAVRHFGRIDVLVNNAGYGQLGMFEEVPAGEIERQYATNVFGAYHVMRAVLPLMREQRRGHIFNISSVGGMRSGPGGGIYCSTKFALEGLSEAVAGEIQPFGLHLTIVEPGFFRTDFLSSNSVSYGPTQIADYAEASGKLRDYYEVRNKRQAGDPEKLARVIIRLSRAENPPLRFAAGSDAVGMIGAKIEQLKNELEEWRDLSVSTDGEFEDTLKPNAA